MTGPDALIVWIALGCLISLGLLALMWTVALQVLTQSEEDAGDQGADWGSEGSFHSHDRETL